MVEEAEVVEEVGCGDMQETSKLITFMNTVSITCAIIQCHYITFQ